MSAELRHCLVYLISPVHVISSLCALSTLHGSSGARATLLVHWPGVSQAVVEELSSIVSELASPFDCVERVVTVSWAEKEALVAGGSLPELVRAMARRLGRGRFDELYYAHDIEGGMQQLLCTVFPDARRICYGDTMGHVYQKEVHLSFLRREPAPRPLAELPRRLLCGLFSRVRRITTAAAAKPLRFPEYRAQAAALVLPVDQSGRFLAGLPLAVCRRDTVLEILGRSTAACRELLAYQASLLERLRGRDKFLLLTENSAEGGFIDFERESEMYCAVIRQYCRPGGVVLLKSHPGETLPRNQAISRRLAGEFEVVALEAKLSRYPIELWRELVAHSTVICMSYPVLSLKYLYDKDVIQPMDRAFVERWFPEWTWASYKNATALYMEPLKRLAGWDGTGVLWAGRGNEGSNS